MITNQWNVARLRVSSGGVMPIAQTRLLMMLEITEVSWAWVAYAIMMPRLQR